MQKKGFPERLRKLFKRSNIDEELFEELEEILIEGDIGPKLATEAVDKLEEDARKEQLSDLHDLQQGLKSILLPYIKTTEITPSSNSLSLFLFLGVNGVGKTTTIAKTARYFQKESGIDNAVFAAGDTFRAAAIEQLKLWGERAGCRVVSQAHGADPASVIYDSIESASARGERLILADTAGRMHNKAHLIAELEKINRIILKKAETAYYKKLLVIDATTGRNAVRQAEIFHQAIGVDAAILTKFDSSAKGGIVASICSELDIPFCFLGTGENLDDLSPFDPSRFLDELLGIV